MSMEPMEPLVDLLKTLAHPARLRILAVLRDGELCVCQINAVVGLAPSTVSEHLTELRRAGLLSERKDGRWVYYKLKPKRSLLEMVEVLWKYLDKTRPVHDDRKRALSVRMAPVDLVCSQNKSNNMYIKSMQGDKAIRREHPDRADVSVD
ncbi:MAG TPA: metalloregulator ArsR/SmtB family transcription factor [Holophaga sp.]|nr:metalloregulator ArsR/SmtB family transcription factor [Holophaga sp.]HPS67969.1 metalloregulator ArsR/SmtB family transcription factor [Holophaga sp.]